ncbi:MAG TPA: hypothetical protein VKT52_04185, partial [Ktedonobacterales bacterium]|nr:hypothetical protein [Ktedonobacterales bacterium]
MPQTRTTGHQAELWRRPLVWVQRHGIALGIVLLACAFAQGITLSQVPRIVVDNDGPSYLQAAHAILTQHQFLNATRTPGYPLFLALIFSVTGEHNLAAITSVQAVLAVTAALEIYALAYLVTRRRWKSCLLAVLAGTNLYILDWERLVRDETLSLLIAVTLFLVLALYVRSERKLLLGMLTVVCLAAALTR